MSGMYIMLRCLCIFISAVMYFDGICNKTHLKRGCLISNLAGDINSYTVHKHTTLCYMNNLCITKYIDIMIYINIYMLNCFTYF